MEMNVLLWLPSISFRMEGFLLLHGKGALPLSELKIWSSFLILGNLLISLTPISSAFSFLLKYSLFFLWVGPVSIQHSWTLGLARGWQSLHPCCHQLLGGLLAGLSQKMERKEECWAQQQAGHFLTQVSMQNYSLKQGHMKLFICGSFPSIFMWSSVWSVRKDWKQTEAASVSVCYAFNF